MGRDDFCPICNKGPEDINHALLACEWTRAVWFGCPLNFVVHEAHGMLFGAWLEDKLKTLSTQGPEPGHAISYLCILLWEIWKMRNKAIFEGQIPNPIMCLNFAASLHMESSPVPQRPVHLQRGTSQQSGPVVWKKPPHAFLKCNTDAAFSPLTRKASGAFIFRDELGNVSCGSARKIYAHSPLAAEANILREAVNCAHNLDQKKVVFESDNKPLIEACNGERQIGEISSFVQDIGHWRTAFPEWFFSWTPREGNVVAHAIAQLEMASNLPPLWLWCPPPALLSLLQQDMRHG